MRTLSLDLRERIPASYDTDTLTVSNLNRRHAGSYAVVARNPGGATLSCNSVVRVISQETLRGVGRGGAADFQIFSADVDGTPLTETDLPLFEVQSSTNLSQWEVLTNALQLTNGVLHLQDDGRSNHPTRYYRIIERW